MEQMSTQLGSELYETIARKQYLAGNNSFKRECKTKGY
jgi:hypothetical protein